MPIGAIKDGDIKFDRGLDSLSDIMSLPPGNYGWGVNMLNRGGVLQSRPGFDWMFTLPQGLFQGLSVFVPALGTPVLVAFVSGTGYVSSYPYKQFTQIQGATMSVTAKNVYTAQCVQSVQSNADGSLSLIAPRQLLICQDGLNPPAYFDGRILTAITGAGVTPQGTYIAWAGSRLWVAQNNLVFASDISNPLSFLEQTYNTLGGVQYFTLPDICTGLAPMPGAPNVNTPLLAFTKTTTTMFQATILNRTLWPTTANFQTEIFPTVGCLASRSIASVSGLLWWMSAIGLTRLDSAQASAFTTQIYRIDRELARSSYNIGDDMSGICSATYENFVLTSVPSANLLNRHTWVYDASANNLASQNAVSYLTTAWSTVWASIWTGVQPVQWASLTLGKVSRLFCASVDTDGNNRVYEAFSKYKRDNGCDFPWAMESRAYTGGTPDRKHFRFMVYSLSELQGEVTMRISWAGAIRGRWKKISTPTFYAEEGSLNATVPLSANTQIFALKKQSRIASTEDVRDRPEDEFSSAGIEGLVEPIAPDKEEVDVGFQFRIEGSGPCAIRSIDVYMDPEPKRDYGEPSKIDKPGEHYVQFDGAAASSLDKLENSVPEVYTESYTATAEWNNFVGTATATISGTISQADSAKRALQVAYARAQQYLEETATPYVGGSLVSQS
jgi:hypothetical protein